MTRELDWRIHELMGNDLTGWEWYVEDENSRYSHYICIREMQVWGQKVAVTRKFIPHYSSTWEGFGLMVEWLQERDIYFGVSLSLFHHGWYGAVVNINRINETTYDPSAPLALAKAFIAAMEERENG